MLSCILLDFWNSPICYKKWLSAAPRPSLIGESSAYSQGTSFLLIQLTWLGYVPLTLDSLGGHNASLPKVACNTYLLRPPLEFRIIGFSTSSTGLPLTRWSIPQTLAFRNLEVNVAEPLLVEVVVDVANPASSRRCWLPETFKTLMTFHYYDPLYMPVG